MKFDDGKLMDFQISKESEVLLSRDEKYPDVTVCDPSFGNVELRFEDMSAAVIAAFVFKAAARFQTDVGMMDFRFISEIGKTQMQKTTLVEHVRDHKIFALQTTPKTSLENSNLSRYLTTLVLPENPFIPSIELAFADEENIYVCIEYPLCGELFQNTNDIKRSVCEVCLALSFCHEHGLVLGGLERENLMIGTDGSAKIVEFGNTKKADIDSPFVAPEVREKGHFSISSDWYSLGVILADSSLIMECEDKDLNDLVLLLTSKNRKLRQRFEVIKTHRFFNGVVWVGSQRAVVPTAKEPNGDYDKDFMAYEPPGDFALELMLW